jgi:hypothetical protein
VATEPAKPVVTTPKAPPPAEVTEPAAPPLSASDTAAAQAALRKKLSEAEHQPDQQPQPVKNAKPSSAPQPVHMPQVESKFPQSKSTRLSELLERYRRDEISPADYHSQRAKILAEPNQ